LPRVIVTLTTGSETLGLAAAYRSSHVLFAGMAGTVTIRG
jgi:hypothetical protein